MRWVAIALVLFVAFSQQSTTPWIVDDFEDPTAPVTDPGSPNAITLASIGQIIGGERNITVERIGGGTVSASVNAGDVTLSVSGVGAQGIMMLVYDGMGSLNMDVSEQTDALLFRVDSAVAGTEISARITSTESPGSLSTGIITLPDPVSTGLDVMVPLPGSESFYSDITSLSFMFGRNATTIQYICLVSQLELVLTSAQASVFLGDTISYQLRVYNPLSFPNETVEGNLQIEVQVPIAFGTLDESSITTSQGLIIFSGSNTVVVRPGSILNGGVVVVTFQVRTTNLGTISLQGTITGSSGRRIRSNPVSRVGTIARCCAPEATNVSILERPVSGAGDPHFVGFLGQHFDFHGQPGNVYNLVTDTAFQLNSYFANADRRPKKTKTYMTKLGIMSCGALIYFECNRETGDHVVQFNGKEMQPNDHFKIKRTANIKRLDLANSKTTIKTPNYKMTVRFSESSHSSCHLNFKLTYTHVYGTAFPHGIVGQTAEGTPGEIGIGDNSPNIVAGSQTDYIVSNGDIFGSRFAYNRFSWHGCFGDESTNSADSTKFDSYGS